MIGAIQPSDFAEPSAQEVADLIDQIKAEKVPAIFGSEVFPSPVTEQIASETGATFIDELSDDEPPGEVDAPEHTYLGMLVDRHADHDAGARAAARRHSTTSPSRIRTRRTRTATVPPIISLRHVSAGYEGKPAIENVTLDIEQGQFVGIVGPSGSGKTTLLKTLLGTVPLQRGEVIVDGRPVRGAGARRPATCRSSRRSTGTSR